MSVPLDDLWRFAVSRYGHGEVAERLLALQDQAQADVCLLLWAAWLAERGQTLTPEDWQHAEQQTVELRERVIAPLRRIRRLQPRGSAVYQALKRAELEAEQRLLQQLQTLCPPMTMSGSIPPLHNWLRYRPELSLALQALQRCWPTPSTAEKE